MNKKPKSLIIIVITLSLIVIGLCCYIVYDKVVNKDNKEENTNNIVDKDDNEKSEINNNVINETDYKDLIKIFKDKFNVVYNYYVEWIYCGENEESAKTVGTDTYAISKQFHSYDEMIKYLRNYMSDEVIKKESSLLPNEKENYIEENGKLYCRLPGKDGGDSVVVNTSFQVNSLSDTKAFVNVFATLVDSYSDEDDYYYKNFSVIFEKVNNNWIITKFETND